MLRCATGERYVTAEILKKPRHIMSISTASLNGHATEDDRSETETVLPRWITINDQYQYHCLIDRGGYATVHKVFAVEFIVNLTAQRQTYQ